MAFSTIRPDDLADFIFEGYRPFDRNSFLFDRMRTAASEQFAKQADETGGESINLHRAIFMFVVL